MVLAKISLLSTNLSICYDTYTKFHLYTHKFKIRKKNKEMKICLSIFKGGKIERENRDVIGKRKKCVDMF